jgi:lipoprotein-anchoring transpeptidase ErfK/SrfK
MIIGRLLRQTAIAAATIAAVAGTQAGPASAQLLFWDWGGSNSVGGSGREIVHFSPQYTKGQIIVSFGDRRLYYITRPGEAISYPIAIPREQSRWQGTTSVSDKRVNPSWTPTPDMIAENPRLPRWVPGGHPMNPLGVRALYLGSSTYRIHGTDAPWTIGTAVSKGCIRMYNQDVLDLYPRATVGAKVVVTWQHFGTVASGNSLFGGDDDAAPTQPTGRVSYSKVSR